MFVGCVIVDDGVDHFSRKDLRLDRIEKADELLVPMALHVAADDVEDVEGGEQRGGTVTLVVVRHRPSAARTASGHAAAPSPAMNSRLRISALQRRE
jgi:hypothetical protein